MDEVGVPVDQLMRFLDAIHHSRIFLQRRDEMNAEVHLGEVRWSPLTELVGNAETEFQELLQEQAVRSR